MTIAEIESTLHTLLIRHPNLDEGMLITLLTAGGWEEKTIKDAVVLFKSLQPKKSEESAKVVKIAVPKTEPVVVSTNNTQQTHQKDVFVDVKKTETETVTAQMPVTAPVSNIPPVTKTVDVKLTEKPVSMPITKPVATIITETPALTTLPKKEDVIVPQKTQVVNVQENTKISTSLNTAEIVYIDSDGKEEDILPSFNKVVVNEPLDLDWDNKINVPTPTPTPTPIPIPTPKPVVVPEKTLPKIEIKPVVEVVSKPRVIVKEKEIPKIDTSEIVYFDGTGSEERELKNYVDDGIELPKVTEDLIIPKEVEENKIFSLPNNDDLQSLIVPKEKIKSLVPPPEPPENLPMKPFESAPHVWSFSKYKEVFHGKVMPILSSKEQALVDEQKLKKEEIVKEESPELNQNHKHVGLKIKRTGFDGEDEGLILMTGVTLLIILLLLSYMYSNGRL